jgi:UDP-glucose 4-epimerase
MTGRVLVVGGRGFVGAHVTRSFIRDGWRVAIMNPPMPLDLLADQAARFTDLAGSIEDVAAIDAALSRARPDLVVSLAAYSQGAVGLARSGEADAEKAIAINALGLGRLLERCSAHDVRRLLWSSSTVVFGPKRRYGDAPVTEDAPRHPVTAYGLSKVLAEDIALYHRDRFGLEVSAIRLPLIFGPGCWYAGVAGKLVALFEGVAKGEPQRFEASPGAVDFAYATDAAEAFLALAHNRGALAPVYHMSAFASDFAEVAEALQKQRPDVAIHCRLEGPAIDYPLVDAGLITRDTGFRPRYAMAKSVDAYLEALSRGEA